MKIEDLVKRFNETTVEDIYGHPAPHNNRVYFLP